MVSPKAAEKRKIYDANRPPEERNQRDKDKKRGYNQLKESHRDYSNRDTEEWKSKDRARRVTRYRERRMMVLRFYSGDVLQCKCCNEKTVEFLTIDHVKGGGAQHRKEVGVGSKFITWLINNHFPLGFQVLCSNCNTAKGIYGVCPHQRGL